MNRNGQKIMVTANVAMLVSIFPIMTPKFNFHIDIFFFIFSKFSIDPTLNLTFYDIDRFRNCFLKFFIVF